ncbi:helix-turn-helix domain-containing protein [Streptomyces sp. enrichment culture]|uniref:helix-turn-helix domain-containing protein n=1 Tax=Streptomyces sp. enrichment culture TaxID=1795815 RepID=UPI003F54EC73
MPVPSTDFASRTPRSSGVQSVARAAALLGAVVDSPSGGATLTELSRLTGLNVSTVHRLLGTLCAEGLLCRSLEGDRFRPGPVLLRLGRRSLASTGLPEVTAVLEEPADATGEPRASACAAATGAGAGSVQSEQLLRYLGEPGVSVPLTQTAMGVALQAFDAASPRERDPSQGGSVARGSVAGGSVAGAGRGHRCRPGRRRRGVVLAGASGGRAGPRAALTAPPPGAVHVDRVAALHPRLGAEGSQHALSSGVPRPGRPADTGRHGGRPFGRPAGAGPHLSAAARALTAAGLRGLSTRST